MDNKRKNIYNQVSKYANIGTFEEFDKAMDDPNRKRKFFDNVSSMVDLGEWDGFNNTTNIESLTKADPELLKKNKEQVAKQIEGQQKIAIPDVLYNGMQELKNIYETPGNLVNRGLSKLQENPLAGAIDLGQGIAQGAFTLTGIPQTISTISTGLKSIFGEPTGKQFDDIMNMPSTLVEEGTKALDKAIDPITQQKAITMAVQGLLSTNRPEFQVLSPLLTEQGQQELSESIGEINKLGATLLAFNAIGKTIPKKTTTPKIEETNKGEVVKEQIIPKAEELTKDLPTLEEAKGTPPVKYEQQTNPELQSSIIPGAKEFVEQDIIPKGKSAIQGLIKSKESIQGLFAPASLGEGKKTAEITRSALGVKARSIEVVAEQLKDAQKYFDNKPTQEKLDFIDGIEGGQLKGTPQEKLFGSVVRKVLDKDWQELNNRGLITAYIEDYFPHMWKDPQKAMSVFEKSFTKRPLEGTKSFLKERKLPTIKEGIDLGLELASDNPIDMVKARHADVQKLVMSYDLMKNYKQEGLTKFIKFGEKPPEGWRKIDDKIGKVLQFSEKEKGFVIRGEYYMPENSARIINNYLSKGLQGNPIYDSFRALGNSMNQVQLGLSFFHGMFTSIDAMLSKVALGNMQLSQGRLLEAGKSYLTAPTAPITNIMKGNKLIKDYLSPTPKNPVLVEAIERAGGRVKMDSFYGNNSTKEFFDAFRKSNPIGGVLRAPLALIEASSKPLMEYVVPRQKMGVFADLAENVLAESKKNNWTKEIETQRLQEAWNSVDNRMGQLVYDNLFWKKTLKDLSLASVRSVGWNLGTFRELGGGLKDVATQAKSLVTSGDMRLTPRMSYTVTLPIVMGALGGMVNYLYTGEQPQELKDYYFPKTGRKLPDGNDERISMPSYMKDVFAFANAPAKTVSHKMHPAIGTVIDMLNNQDYYGYEIKNPEDPLLKQVAQELEYVGQQFVPFSVKNLQQRKSAGDTFGGQTQSFFGITPATKNITNTPMQNEISTLYQKRFGGVTKPFDAKAKDEAKKEIKDLLTKGDAEEAKDRLSQLILDKTISPTSKEVRYLFNNRKPKWDILMFRRLQIEDKIDLLKKMDDADLEKYLPSAGRQVFRDTELVERANKLLEKKKQLK